jgi:uncharacterized membrane protein HdeD (DUF308 family)
LNEKAPEKAPNWLRTLDVIFGLIAVLLSVTVLVYPGLAILTLILILSLALLVLGIARISKGIFEKYLSDGFRAFNIIMGSLVLILGITVVVFPDFGTSLLITLLSVGLLFNGIGRIIIGGFVKVLPSWLRSLLVIIGLLTVVFSIAVLLLPNLGAVTLAYIVAISFLVNGIARIIEGINGTYITKDYRKMKNFR